MSMTEVMVTLITAEQWNRFISFDPDHGNRTLYSLKMMNLNSMLKDYKLRNVHERNVRYGPRQIGLDKDFDEI